MLFTAAVSLISLSLMKVKMVGRGRCEPISVKAKQPTFDNWNNTILEISDKIWVACTGTRDVLPEHAALISITITSLMDPQSG